MFIWNWSPERAQIRVTFDQRENTQYMSIQPTSRIRACLVSHVLICICFSIFLFQPELLAQDIDPEFQKKAELTADVVIDGYVLFNVRGLSSYPAEYRAKTIESRIIKIASDKTFTVDSIKLMAMPDHIQVMAGQQLIMNVFDVDAALESVTKEILAHLVRTRIEESIHRYRSERQPDYIKTALLKALGALAILLVSLLFFVWIFGKLNEIFKRRIKVKIDNLENVSFKLIQSEQFFKVFHLIFQLLRLIIIVVIIVFFADYVLSLFPRTRQLADVILRMLIKPLEDFGLGFINILPNLVFLGILFLLTQYLIKLIRLFFTGIDIGQIQISSFDQEWAMPTFKIVKFLVIIFALVIAYPYIPGSDSSAFQGISVFLGILFSLGSSSFIANIIAGYSMTYRRAFKNGDRIQVNEFMGFVQEQTLMVTRLKSVKNEEIVIPNSILLNSSIKNYSQAARERGIILHTTVGIGYETSWRLVEAMLIEAANRTPGLLKDPVPWVFQQSLNDFAVTYEINALCKDPEQMYFIYTDLHRNILDVFNENNIQIMTPAYEGDPAAPKVVPKDQWDTTLASKMATPEKGQSTTTS